MKKLFSTMLIILLSTAGAWAEDPIATQTSTQLNAHAQQMVAQGVPPEAAAKMQNRFEEQHMVQARNIVQAAKQQGVPVDPLVDKALEGLAKNVPEQNIVNAMEQVRNRYAAAISEAKQMTQTKSRQQAMTRSMAHAMSAGMSPEDVSAIADKVRSRKRTMARVDYEVLAEETFSAARDMARMGTPSKDVKDTLSAAMQNQYSAKQINQMHNKFMNQARNIPPETVAKQFQAQIRSGNDFGQQGPGSGSGSRSGGGGSGGSDGGSGGSGGGSGGSDGGSGGSGGGSGGSGGGSGGSGGGSGGSDGGSGGSGGGNGGGNGGGKN